MSQSLGLEESERINRVARRAAVVGPSTIREACSNAPRSSAPPKKMTATRSESCSSDMAVVEAAKRPRSIIRPREQGAVARTLRLRFLTEPLKET
uniref:Uncharacterized protein n=1 Tax=Nelumbo nucifera TaxID=4432 RepID=A0A822Y0A3_NELNU|nr:TPA_asm: hypothetical protein HUJ06_024541 [Nelumbo nucifera]